MNGEPLSANRKAIVTLLVYAFANGLFVFIPFMPGPAIFIGWGAVLPLFFITGTWSILAQTREENKDWSSTAIICTVGYCLFGFLTFYFVGAMWAAV